MKAKKSLGQNFLMHAQTAERIALASSVTKEDTVLEIGPGTGMLTRALLAHAKKVIAVEADYSLVPKLEVSFAEEIGQGRLELIQADVRSFNTKHLKGSYHLVANIPYYLTGEIFRQFLTAKHKPSSMTLLVQKEVAVRIARSKKESLLSLSVKAFGTPKIQFPVPRGAFRPAPNVDSAVISITDIAQNAFKNAEDEKWFFDVLHAGFAHKRKQLAKNLEALASSEHIREAFSAASIDSKARAEDLTLPTWRSLGASLRS
jgi:16S rRNA (adenine1518-N6/adenine1519-N6)-dimethyltransferase